MKKLLPILSFVFILFLHNYTLAQAFLTAGNNYMFNVNDDLVKTEERKWSISFIIGNSWLGPTRDIVEAMKKVEFDQKHRGWFSGDDSTKYPKSYEGGFAWLVNVKYDLTGSHSIGIISGNSYLGEAQGHHEETGFLYTGFSVFFIAPVYSINLYDYFRIGIGPALYLTETHESIGREKKYFNNTKIGLLIDAGLRYPSKSLFFAELNFQYRIVGKVEVGPFKLGHGEDMAFLPKTEINYKHYLIGVGFGIRF